MLDVKAGAYDPIFRGGEYSDATQDGVKAFICSLQLRTVEIIAGVFPEHTGRHLMDKQFEFCLIDVDTYQSAKSISEWVWGILTIGGVIVYDDFGNLTTPGVTRLVEEQFQIQDRIVVHNVNGHAVVVKTSA
jgi:O-methyltransferase